MINNKTNFWKNFNWKALITIVIIYIVVSVVLIGIFKIPAFIPWLNLGSENDNNLASAINNFTAPILGIVTVYFVYMAFIKQLEANNSQMDAFINEKNTNEIQIIFSLFDQLHNELNNFNIFIDEDNPAKRREYKGYKALKEFSIFYKNDLAIDQPFGNFSHSRMIMGIVNSMMLIEYTINGSLLPDDYQILIRAKLKGFYYSWLDLSFKNIKKCLDKHPELIDQDARCLLDLMNRYDKENEC